MFWSRGPDKPPDKPDPSSTSKAADAGKDDTRKTPFDPDKLPERHKLSPSLQKIVDKADKDDNIYDQLVDG